MLIGEFLVAQAFDIGAANRPRAISFQLFHAPVNPPTLSLHDCLLFGAGFGVGKIVCGVDFIGHRLAGTDEIDGSIAGDRRQPRRCRPFGCGELLGPLPDLHVNFLQYLFGIRPVANNTQAYAIEFRAGTFIKRGKSLLITHGDAADKRFRLLVRHPTPACSTKTNL